MSVPQVEIAVSTQSEPIPNAQQPAVVPNITLNGTPFPAPSNKAYSPSGWQVAVLDSAQDLTQPEAVLSNLYIPLQEDNGTWGDWEAMYDDMVTQVFTSGNVGMQIVIVTSYGMDANLPPTNDGLEMVLGYGAGPQVQAWLNTPLDIGSEGGDWTGTPANYILIGASGLAYGNGTETFNMGTDGGVIPASATTTFANPGAVTTQ
jgi:hypothetical protein